MNLLITIGKTLPFNGIEFISKSLILQYAVKNCFRSYTLANYGIVAVAQCGDKGFVVNVVFSFLYKRYTQSFNFKIIIIICLSHSSAKQLWHTIKRHLDEWKTLNLCVCICMRRRANKRATREKWSENFSADALWSRSESVPLRVPYDRYGSFIHFFWINSHFFFVQLDNSILHLMKLPDIVCNLRPTKWMGRWSKASTK